MAFRLAVVMVTILALAAAQSECGVTRCRMMTKEVEVESCGVRGRAETTICAGNCYHEALVYRPELESPRQDVCVGDWHYEPRLVPDCPVPAWVPVFHSCSCARCPEHADCGDVLLDLPSCLAPPLGQ